MAATSPLVDAWRLALEQPGAADRLALLLRESEPGPGVLRLEIAFGAGSEGRAKAWIAAMARALVMDAPGGWLAVIAGRAARAA